MLLKHIPTVRSEPEPRLPRCYITPAQQHPPFEDFNCSRSKGDVLAESFTMHHILHQFGEIKKYVYLLSFIAEATLKRGNKKLRTEVLWLRCVL